MISEKYGVMVLKIEGLIAVMLLLVGGFLMWQDHVFITPIIALWAIVIQFFYNRRASETNTNNIMTALQQQPPAIIQPTVKPQYPTGIPIVEQPAQPNAPTGQKVGGENPHES